MRKIPCLMTLLSVMHSIQTNKDAILRLYLGLLILRVNLYIKRLMIKSTLTRFA